MFHRYSWKRQGKINVTLCLMRQILGLRCLVGQRPQRGRWPMLSHIWGIVSSSFFFSVCPPPSNTWKIVSATLFSGMRIIHPFPPTAPLKKWMYSSWAFKKNDRAIISITHQFKNKDVWQTDNPTDKAIYTGDWRLLAQYNQEEKIKWRRWSLQLRACF